MHQAIAWRFRFSRSTKLRPGKKFSFTYRTKRSTLPVVWGVLTRHTFGTNPISTAKSENCVPNHFVRFTPCDHSFHIVVQNLFRNTSKILKGVQHTASHAAQITAFYEFNVFWRGNVPESLQKRILCEASHFGPDIDR